MRPDLDATIAQVLESLQQGSPNRAVLVAVSGIDASGKGYVSGRLAASLEACGLRVALLSVDGWLNLPEKRFSSTKPADHFYLHAIRFDEMFERLVLPLRESRSVELDADFTEETATAYRKHRYAFKDVDVVLLEGILLLKRIFRPLYDVSFWVDCSFETALERALARGQEELPPAETAKAYRTIYFPAQEIHLSRDEPRAASAGIVENDWRAAVEPVRRSPWDPRRLTGDRRRAPAPAVALSKPSFPSRHQTGELKKGLKELLWRRN